LFPRDAINLRGGNVLLTITTTHRPATDLGYLLFKNPARPQAFEMSFGRAHVFYPQADDDRCTAALLLEVDPVALVRNRRGPAGEAFALEQYVNDRPYVASSFLSVAIARVLGSALSGTSRERPELATTPIPLLARVSVLPCRGGEGLLRRLFEPLGYQVNATRHPLDEQFPEWGEGPYFTVELSHTITLSRLLAHLYVLVPVLDNDKHYWIGDDEVDKLLRHGEAWLAAHPEKEQIVHRYLKHRRHLAREALAQLLDEDQQTVDEAEVHHAQEEEQVEQKISLNEHRLSAVVGELKASGATRVLDLGCSTGNLLRRLMEDKQFEQIVGWTSRTARWRSRRSGCTSTGSRTSAAADSADPRLADLPRRAADGFDAAAVVEVIEHLDAPRLAAFERVLFEFARRARSC
jgi:3' terminal RNA ribose 2'-O-methyltransferase Hen1